MTRGWTSPDAQTLTITDDESPSTKVTLTVSPDRISEDAAGSDRTVTVTAALDGASRTADTVVTVSVTAGTAVRGDGLLVRIELRHHDRDR